ncbi:nicotinamide riboside transporter PnuC [Halocola ammonii]
MPKKSTLKVLEILAVIFGLAYTYLYAIEVVWCWPFAILGSSIFVYLCYVRRIYAESFLQLFYVLMAFYGYFSTSGEFERTYWTVGNHLLLIGTAAVINVGLGYFLKRQTDSALPFLDAFTTVFSIFATWVMVNYVHENWLYFIVIDAVSVWLYYKRKLYYGAILFVIYTVISILAYFHYL